MHNTRPCIGLCLHLYKNLISELHDSIFRNGMSEIIFFNFLKNKSNKLASFYVSFQGTNTYFFRLNCSIEIEVMHSYALQGTRKGKKFYFNIH